MLQCSSTWHPVEGVEVIEGVEAVDLMLVELLVELAAKIFLIMEVKLEVSMMVTRIWFISDGI